MSQFLECDLLPDPYAQFHRWYEEAKEKEPQLPEAVGVATSTPDGIVSLRMCLLKGFDERGFVFFTNYESRKGEQISSNPRVALCFHWQFLERQVRIEGVAVRVAEEESDAYFASRPRGSQLGAWASDQSSVIVRRGDLEASIRELEQTYADRPVPRPPYWGGYRVIPVLIEFWQGQPDRLHDRFLYRLREPKDWTIERLAP